MATVVEKLGSKSRSSTGATLQYVITDETDRDLAYAALVAARPGTEAGFTVSDTTIEPSDRSDLWFGTVTYKKRDTIPPEGDDTLASITLSLLDIHITSGYGNTKYENTDYTIADIGNAIEVDADGVVHGTTAKQGAMTRTNRYVVESMTSAYQLLLQELAGGINSASFLGFAPKTVRFSGMQSSERPDGYWDLSLTYEMGKFRNVDYPGIDNTISVPPFDHLWAQTARKPNNTTAQKDVDFAAAYVSQTHPLVDMSQTIPTNQVTP